MLQSRHDADRFDAYQRVEVITGGRRRRAWSDDEKARIVAESADPDVNISEVARRNGVSRGLLTVWRRLAHARRKFVALAKSTRSPFAREVVEAIAAIYAIEKRIRGTTAAKRRAVRQVESRPIMTALHARLVAVRDGLSQISPLTKAIKYTLDHWSGLTRFLDDGPWSPTPTSSSGRSHRSVLDEKTAFSLATKAAAKLGRFYRR